MEASNERERVSDIRWPWAVSQINNEPEEGANQKGP